MNNNYVSINIIQTITTKIISQKIFIMTNMISKILFINIFLTTNNKTSINILKIISQIYIENYY